MAFVDVTNAAFDVHGVRVPRILFLLKFGCDFPLPVGSAQDLLPGSPHLLFGPG